MFPVSASFGGEGPLAKSPAAWATRGDGGPRPLANEGGARRSPSEMTPRRMSSVPPQQSSESGNDSQVNAQRPAVNETRGHRLTLTILRCGTRS